MAIKAKHKGVEFRVGDKVRVTLHVKEGEKKRKQVFEGIVIKIKGREEGKTFTVRKIGVNQIGIERIFPLASPSVESIEVSRKGGKGVRRAKLYYIRDKSRREIEKIYSRTTKRETVRKVKSPAEKSAKTKKKAIQKGSKK